MQTSSGTGPGRACAGSHAALRPALVLGLAGALLCSGLAPAAGGEPPQVAFTFPDPDNMSMAANASVYATFRQPLDPSSVGPSTFWLSPPAPGTVSYHAGSRTAFFRPSAPVAVGWYTAGLTTGVRSADGTALPAELRWDFAVRPGADTEPPRAAVLTPGHGAAGVGRNTGLQVFFSEVLDPSTVGGDTFRIDPPVAGLATVDGASRTATFRLAEDLAPDRVYTATVTTGVADTAGNALGSEATWQFTTGAARDESAPSVLSVDPPDGTTREVLPLSLTGASAYFSEAMDATTLTGETVRVNGGPAGGVAYSPASNRVSFWGFPPGEFRVTITAGARDLAGNPLAEEVSWSFRVTPTPPWDPRDSPYCQENPGELGCSGGTETVGGCFLQSLAPGAKANGSRR